MLPILIILGVAGFAVGGQINRAIYRWAWNQRAISPWSTPPEGVAARTWADCVPVFGWWPMRRESKVHGTAFWLRPMMIELAFGIGLAALYWWEVVEMGWAKSLFCAHAILFGLMMIATFIDFDEKSIPDFITIPGTIIALLFAAFLPNSLPPVPPVPMGPVLTTTPFEWPLWLDGVQGLGIGLACWFAWCAALLPRTIYFRRGIVKGFQFLAASLVRFPGKRIGLMSLIGACVISVVWFVMSGAMNWQTLLSSLIAMAAVGGFVWSIRIVTSMAMGMEALGFGDVTLMAMVGAFLGWQAGIISFFAAPFVSFFLIIAIVLLTGSNQIPFGPMLCLGTAIVAVQWDTVWSTAGVTFNQLGPLLPIGLAVLVALMGIAMALIRIVKRMLGYDRH